MSSRFAVRITLVVAALMGSVSQASPQSAQHDAIVEKMSRRVTQEQRQAAADRLKAARQANRVGALAVTAAVDPVVGQGDLPDYFGVTPNWNYTPVLRKFVDGLPLLGPAGANTLGQYLPVAVPDRSTYPGIEPGVNADYYEIAVVQYEEQMHSDLPSTTLRGYVQIDTPAIPDTPTRFALTYPDGSPILNAGGSQVYAVDKPHYLGPVIIAQRNVPVRIKLCNHLPTGVAGDFFIPVDPSVMGAGMGPNMIMAHMAMAMGTDATIMTMHSHGLQVGDKVMLRGFEPSAYNGYFTITGLPSPTELQVGLKSDPGGDATVVGDVMEMYTENRAVLHLHGGRTPWISDGTPHQWITPAGEDTSYPQGVSVQPVPDMGDSGDSRDGTMTYYYTNQQSARLMFYHDHVYGITRLNVYAGEAAGYMIQDPIEDALVAAGFIPAEQIPLIIQDKTFVDAATIGDLDPTWRWGTGTDANMNGYPDYKTGDLWVPHVYMPAQNPYDISGMAAMGRWHYGPWFWPPTVGIGHPPIPNPYYDPITRPWQPPEIPDVPDPSMGMEAFNDTPLVNGTCYPTITVDPKAYRFRILSAANDRFFNLQLYEADPAIDIPGVGLTEVRMVPASVCNVDPNWPRDFTEGNPTWPVDGRDGGVPDWNMRGPEWIQIGTEGGFLPMPAVIPQRPVDWNVDVTTFDAGLVNSKSLLLGPAERADVIVDFTAFAGKTLILYNDAPAAFPAPDARYDYYTGMPDMTDTGGHYPTDPGLGPNTRTIMQIKVNLDPVADSWLGLAAMEARWESTAIQDGVFIQDQDPLIVGQGELVPGYDQYNRAYNTTFPSTWPNWGITRIHDTSLRFQTVAGDIVTIPLERKAIQDEMGETFDDYGRMSGKLGLQLPNPIAGGQTFVLQSYVDPATEVITASMTPLTPPLAADGTQIWKITHNGVDVHPIHFHLFDVQLINRVAWDNNVRLPDANELGWKETVRVNPLQDTIVALRPVAPGLPFKLPDSVRLLDPTMPEGATWPSFDPFTAAPVTVTNLMTNFGWEYMWHCHILSHEEMEMMRPAIYKVAPAAPSGLTAVLGGSVDLAWVNNATVPVATSLLIERAADSDFTQGVATFTVADPTVTAFADTTVAPATMYYYRVRAENDLGYSPWSNTASVVTLGMEGNVVTDWNVISVNAIRTASYTSLAASRVLAMVHAAVYDSVNSITGTYQAYRMSVPGVSGASKEAAAAAAAHRVLSILFPGQSATLDVVLSMSLSAIADGPAKTDGIALGQAVADSMLVWRSTDHSSDMMMYMGGTDPGQWRPTPPSYAMGMMPLWGTVTPFAMTSGSQFRLAPPPALDSLEYGQAVNEVKTIGMQGSASRSAEQTQIAYFWADSPGTITTVGRWNAIARDEAIARAITVEEAARLFAVLDVALADAGIAAWDSKYHYALWRPITAIREAAVDGNPLTEADPAWLPELVTPAFPEYASAHSTFSGAGAEALKRFFATDSAAISIAAFDNPASHRSYISFTEAADEAGVSRIYGGIHYKFSDVAGNAAGRNVAGYVYDTYFLYLPSLPAAPTNLVATAIGPRQVDLTWADNSPNETGFRVERAIDAGAFAPIQTLAAGATAFSDTTAPDGTVLNYRVFAFNVTGDSPASNTATATTPVAPPSNLLAVVQSNLRVALEWTDNSGSETGFVLERSVNGGAFAQLATLPPSAGTGGVVSYADTTVTSNTYAYRVKAVNGAVSSAYAGPVTAIVPPPAAPNNLVGMLQAGPQIGLTWTDNSTSETGFVLERSVNGGAFAQIAAPAARNNTGGVSYTDVAVTPGNTYVYQVKAVSGAVSSAYATSGAILVPSPPAVPSNLTATAQAGRGNGNNRSVTLRWTDNANNETGFTVQRATNAAFTAGLSTSTVAAAAGTGSIVTVQQTGLSRTTTFYFRVQAANTAGVSAWVTAIATTQ